MCFVEEDDVDFLFLNKRLEFENFFFYSLEFYNRIFKVRHFEMLKGW